MSSLAPGTVQLKCPQPCNTLLETIYRNEARVNEQLQRGLTCPKCGAHRVGNEIFVWRVADRPVQ